MAQPSTSAPSLRGSIQSAFKKIESFKKGGKQYSKITQIIVYFLCTDYRPFYTIQGRGFQRLIRELAPLYKIPCEETIKKVMDTKFDVISEMYKKQFREIDYFCVTCDIWSEMMSCRSFLGITVHYILNNKLATTSIAVHPLDDRHTANLIGSKLSELLLQWNINPDKVVAVVTDSAANMVSAIQTTFGKDKHIPCFAHLINLVSENILTKKQPSKVKEQKDNTDDKHVSDLIEKVRTIVKWVKASVINSDEIRKLQINSGVAQGNVKKLILDVKTRWNSSFYMLERFVDMSGIVNEMLLNKPTAPPMVTAVEMLQIKEIILILKPLEFLTKETCAEQHVTISKVIPMMLCLSRNLESINVEMDLVKHLKEQLQAEIHKRFGKIEFVSNMAIATILDPRFKNMYFTQPLAKSQALLAIKQMIKPIHNIDGQESQQPGRSNASINRDGNDFWSYHNTLTQQSIRQREESDSLKDELDLYLKTPLALLTSDPLEEWSKLKHAFPILYKVAMKYLTATATSVPSERLFSRAGNTITQSRNRLLGSRLNKMCFLASIPEENWLLNE